MLAQHKELFAVCAWKGCVKVHRPCGQQHRLRTTLADKVSFFANDPDVCRPIARRLKDEILSVRCPSATTFCRRLIPVRKQRVQVTAVRTDLPKGAGVRSWIHHRKSQAASV